MGRWTSRARRKGGNKNIAETRLWQIERLELDLARGADHGGLTQRALDFLLANTSRTISLDAYRSLGWKDMIP